MWHEKFCEFSPNHSKVTKFHFDGLFLSKVYMRFELKIQRSYPSWHWKMVWCAIWINLGLVVSRMAWGIGWTFIKALKSLKNYKLMVSFCPKHIFQLENLRGIIYHDTEGWCKIWRKVDLRLEKRHKQKHMKI